MPWVLRQTKKTLGTSLCFREWTGIGPRFTTKLSEAARFKTKQDAMQSPCWSYPYTVVEAKKIKK